MSGDDLRGLAGDAEHAGAAGDGDLDALRRRIEGLDDMPLERHPDVFDEVHAALAAELVRLEEV